MRTERDSMGETAVPDEALYGAHTSRSLRNFDAAGEPVPLEIVRAIVQLKWACARANLELGVLDPARGEAIICACEAVLGGACDDAFPVDVFQAGSGTSTNMNVNEVLANLASEDLGGRRGERGRVHPNDDVNRGQSTNNVFPSAIRMACVELGEGLDAETARFEAALRGRAKAFAAVIKSGRTHLQDAVPVTLGQEFAAWARAVEKARERARAARENLLEIGIGGNAVGTGLNTKRAFRPAIVRALGEITGRAYRVPADGLEITQSLTDLAQMSAALRLLAADINRIANDLRLLASGPNTGFDEIALPAVEPGSSIMPGKINPSICEAANMACLYVMGLDHAVALACGAGQLELNTHMPLVGWNLVRMFHALRRTLAMFGDRCIAGIRAREDVCRRHFERSAGLPTVLNPRLGYDRVAELVKDARARGLSLRELVIEKKLLPPDELDALLRRSTGPED